MIQAVGIKLLYENSFLLGSSYSTLTVFIYRYDFFSASPSTAV